MQNVIKSYKPTSIIKFVSDVAASLVVELGVTSDECVEEREAGHVHTHAHLVVVVQQLIWHIRVKTIYRYVHSTGKQYTYTHTHTHTHI